MDEFQCVFNAHELIKFQVQRYEQDFDRLTYLDQLISRIMQFNQ